MKRKFLVGMLYSGESEYELSVTSLKSQSLKDWDLYEVKNLREKEAHDNLYAYFMSQADSYEYFFKLDADMVLEDQSTLQKIYDVCYEENLAHLMSYVYDCPSRQYIPGVQIFRCDCLWMGSNDLLNTDYAPKLFGKSKAVMDEKWVKHMPQPSEYQLFRYGIHKALKSLQPDRKDKSMTKFLMHLNILQGIARHAKDNTESNVFFALIGAYLFAEGVYKQIEQNTDEAKRLFTKLTSSDEILNDYKNRAMHYWRHDVQSSYKWHALMNK